MIPTLALALTLLVDPAPGDGVRLAPDPAPAAVSSAMAIPAPVSPAPSLPFPAAAAGAVAGLAALAASRWTGRGEEDEGLTGPGEPLVVFVSGHGSPSAPGVFAHLVEMMGIDPTRARYFDYRWAGGGTDHDRASEQASIDETADALDGYLAGLADSGQSLYLVGFSKGGTGIAELVARWDRGEPGAAEAVQGATLLDPPMASGIHGFLQSLGTAWGPIPDDGGYNPVSCSAQGCTDTRRHLGEASGVDLLVVRNPQAGITNFADVPEGLRVYEASDGGSGFVETLFTRPWDLVGRVTEAHFSVLHDARVADCIVAEMEQVGTCSLPRAGQGPPAGLIVHGPGSAGPSLNRAL